ncbi:hypothetical protein sr15870 [Sporisorium reilianum SRZ2]|uniref:Uncharacterized protein n=1 Tax=Sporisorium reilianum (strain SRZ2) TaxID=999809 RepID=E6ZQ98_SPORE|nr:hypothetical protein sr15870 [Sporisorium reilianum SRZ2]
MSYTQGGRVYLVASRGSLDNPSMRTHRVAQTLVGGHELDIVRDQDLPSTWAPLSSWAQAALPCALALAGDAASDSCARASAFGCSPESTEAVPLVSLLSRSIRARAAPFCHPRLEPRVLWVHPRKQAAPKALGHYANGIGSVASTHCHARMRGDELRLRAHPSKFPLVSAPATHVKATSSRVKGDPQADPLPIRRRRSLELAPPLPVAQPPPPHLLGKPPPPHLVSPPTTPHLSPPTPNSSGRCLLDSVSISLRAPCVWSPTTSRATSR